MTDEIAVKKVVVRRATKGGSQWRAISIAMNGEKIATSETYHRYEDAERAAYTMSEGAPIEKQDDPWPERPPPPPLENWPTKEGGEGAASSETADE